MLNNLKTSALLAYSILTISTTAHAENTTPRIPDMITDLCSIAQKESKYDSIESWVYETNRTKGNKTYWVECSNSGEGEQKRFSVRVHTTNLESKIKNTPIQEDTPKFLSDLPANSCASAYSDGLVLPCAWIKDGKQIPTTESNTLFNRVYNIFFN